MSEAAPVRINWDIQPGTKPSKCPACAQTVFWVRGISQGWKVIVNADGTCHRVDGSCVEY